jgi:hypothetical protein
MGIIWLKAGIWKLSGISRCFERGRCPLCLGEEDAKQILLKCSETITWREECVSSNWLNINEDIAYRKIISCTNVNKIISLGKYLFKTKCKWENKVGGGLNPPDLNGSWKPKYKKRNWIDSRISKGAVVVILVALAIATDLT